MKNIMFCQTFSEHDLLPMSVVSLNKKPLNTLLFSVVLYPAPLLTLHFCVSSYSDNFVEIGNPLLMIRFHAFICSRTKEATMHSIAKTPLKYYLCQYFTNQRMYIWYHGDIT